MATKWNNSLDTNSSLNALIFQFTVRKYTKIHCAFVFHCYNFFLKFGGQMSANIQIFCHLSSKRWNHNRKSWTLTLSNILDGPLDKLVLFLRPQKRSNLHSMPPFLRSHGLANAFHNGFKYFFNEPYCLGVPSFLGWSLKLVS